MESFLTSHNQFSSFGYERIFSTETARSNLALPCPIIVFWKHKTVSARFFTSNSVFRPFSKRFYFTSIRIGDSERAISQLGWSVPLVLSPVDPDRRSIPLPSALASLLVNHTRKDDRPGRIHFLVAGLLGELLEAWKREVRTAGRFWWVGSTFQHSFPILC